MDAKDGESSGYTSPNMPPTPATSHQLKRTLSQETLATTITNVSSTPSFNYPNPPINSPATRSVTGDNNLDATVADFEALADRLQRTTPPVTPSTATCTGASDVDSDPFKEGKAHLRADLREDAELVTQLFKSPEGKKRPKSKHELLRKYAFAPDRSSTPTRLSSFTSAAAAPPTFEYNSWGPVAEEDTTRALKRMAMLARDEHQKDPSHSVEEYYSMRLAKLIEEAEVAFDATHLQ